MEHRLLNLEAVPMLLRREELEAGLLEKPRLNGLVLVFDVREKLQKIILLLHEDLQVNLLQAVK